MAGVPGGWVCPVGGVPGGWCAGVGLLFWCQARPAAGGWLVVGWLWVEMCIVDASILLLLVLCVLCCGLCDLGKLVRADGGCLGTRGR